MVSRRETLAEALRTWRAAERELFEAAGAPGGTLASEVVRFRNAYQQMIYTEIKTQ
jgi:hypothetical protein